MDALREEHGRRMREEEEERRRQKQAVMSYKLEMMRAKKHVSFKRNKNVFPKLLKVNYHINKKPSKCGIFF